MSLNDLSGTSNRRMILVHGRDFKPATETYLDLSLAAIRAGVERDYPQQLGALDDVQKSNVWYGDLNADVLETRGNSYDESLDVGDRRNVLQALRSVNVRKKFGIREYDQLPGKSAVPEALVDLAAPILGSLGLCLPLIRAVSKDFAAYFDAKSEYSSMTRERLRRSLCESLDRGDRVALLTHGTGSVVAYDVLWQLSHDPEFKEQYGKKKIELWVTFGSPLGDSSIRKRLLGAREKVATRYPHNLISWHNVAAEDDYTCHDNTLADDFKSMLQQHLISSIQDYRIFNLAVRYGKSNPHSSIGYFIHPRTTKILVDWLCAVDAEASPKYSF